jgi:hypothetical protein
MYAEHVSCLYCVLNLHENYYVIRPRRCTVDNAVIPFCMQTGITVHWRQIGSSLGSSERRLDNMRSGEQDAVRCFQYFPHCSPVACEA